MYKVHVVPHQDWPELDRNKVHFSCMENDEWDSDFSGWRMCMGEQMTRVEMFLVVSHLLQSFTFTPPPGEPPVQLSLTVEEHPPFRMCAIQRE